MTVVEARPSARHTLIRLHPLIRLVLRRGPGLDERQRSAILRRVVRWCQELVEREPQLSMTAVSTSVHTRLRQVMADPRHVSEESAEDQAEDSARESSEQPPSAPSGDETLLEDLDAVEARRRAAVRELMDSLNGLQGSILKLAVGDGLNDVEIAARAGIASDQVGHIGAELLRKLEDAWLAADPVAGRLSDSPAAEDALFFHYIAYVRGKLDPDRMNLTESHAFRYVRNGSRIAALQVVYDQIRAGEWKPKVTVARGKRAPVAAVAGTSVAVVAAGILTSLVVISSIGREELRAGGTEMSILEPAPLPSGLSVPVESPHAETLEEAIAAYSREDYSEAAESWRRLYDGGATIPDLGLYLGVSQFLSGDSRGAVHTLARQVPMGTRGIPYHFYRAQALLVLGRVEEAREELRAVLSSGDSGYRADAERQLTTLLTPQANR